jgi:hypothetical protein
LLPLAKQGLAQRLAASAAVSRSNIAFYDRLATMYDDIFVEHARHADNMIEVLASHDAILANRHSSTSGAGPECCQES